MTDDILTKAERLEFDELPTSPSSDLISPPKSPKRKMRWLFCSGILARLSWMKRYLFSDDHWAENRQKYLKQLSLPENPHQFIAEMKEKFRQISTSVDSNSANNSFVEIVDGALSLSRDKASPKNEEVKQLKQSVHKILPRIKLPDLLIEVDKWTKGRRKAKGERRKEKISSFLLSYFTSDFRPPTSHLRLPTSDGTTLYVWSHL